MIDFCVSFTTIPSRIDNLEKTIDSINGQTLKANKIFLNLPYEFKRFPDIKFNKNQITKLEKFNVELNRSDDYGPSTKLMGALEKIKKFKCVIILDDDHIYHNKMFEIFINEFKKKKNNYSFYVQKIFKLNMGQGADGILINTENLSKIGIFYNKFVKNNNNLFFNDDLWISMYLQFIENNKIIDLSKNFKEITNKDLVYKIHSNMDSLKEVAAKKILNRRKIAKIEYFKFRLKNYFKSLSHK